MSDTTLAAGVSSASSPNTVDLLANNSGLLIPQKGTLDAGQQLPRGAILGRVTLTGKYLLALAAVTDGSQVPAGVLAHDTDATAGDVEALVYTRGDFNGAAMTLGAGHTPSSVQSVLRRIFIHKPYGA